jgi:hypothetical protein
MSKITTDMFKEKAKKIHGEKYDYSLVNYKNCDTKIKIICLINDHGEFEQTPYRHLRGSGCSKCAGIHSPTTEEFTNVAKTIHGEKYDYRLVDYKNTNIKIKIICKKEGHGIFEQLPQDHILKKSGCPKCAGCHQHTTEEFINNARITHGDKYDYSESEYINAKSKIKIKCKHHGIFVQTPRAHISGSGCPICCSSVSFQELIWLNIINIPEQFRHHRIILPDNSYIMVDGFDPNTNTIYEFNGDFWHGNPKIYNPEQINKRNKYSFGQLHNELIHRNQKIIDAGYNLVSIWEDDFKKQYKQEIIDYKLKHGNKKVIY